MKLRPILFAAIAAVLCDAVPSFALPGDTTEEVANWIQTNPLLPRGREGSLRVSRSIPGQRLTFVASVTLPTQRRLVVGENYIRSEWIELLDYENGVTRDRLVESLRAIYGFDLYRDYRDAEVVYDYVTPIGEEIQTIYRGVLLQGDRFGYWVEILEGNDNNPVLGTLAIVLPEDLDRLEADLRDRGGLPPL